MDCIKRFIILLIIGLCIPINDCYAHAEGKFLALKRAENLDDQKDYLEEATRYYWALKQDPNNKSVLLKYADVEEALGNYDYALGLLDCYSEKFGVSSDYWKLRARLFVDAGFYSGGLGINTALRDSFPNETAVLAVQTDALFQANLRCAALQEYHRITCLDPKSDDLDDLRDEIIIPRTAYLSFGNEYNSYFDPEDLMTPSNQFQYINQSDTIEIIRIPITGTVYINPVTVIISQLQHEILKSNFNTNLETIDGKTQISDTEFLIGLRRLFDCKLESQLILGDLKISDGYDTLVFTSTNNFLINQQTFIVLEFLRELYRPIDLTNGSPRSVSLHILEKSARSHISLRPGLQSAIEIDMRASRLSDNNCYWRLSIDPDVNVYNGNIINIDLGLDTEMYSFANPRKGNLNGYYAPRLYQLYELVGLINIVPHKNLSLQVYGAGGVIRDENSHGFQLTDEFGVQVKQAVNNFEFSAGVSYLYWGLLPHYHEVDVSIGLTWRLC